MINKSLPSWMGLRNPLGGPIEVVRNINEASQKLVPSSFYYKVSSSWHMLGQRSSWLGESFDEKDYNIRPSGINDFSKLETGFRCMQEEWLE